MIAQASLYLIALILIMSVYIIWLHIRLARKNSYIESTIKHLAEIQKNWSIEELVRFFNEVRKSYHFSNIFSDKLFDEKPLNFLFENINDSKVFIHYTRERDDAISILSEGFRFTDSFYKTAVPVTADKLDLLVKHNGKKSYGDYLVVIVISSKIYNHYNAEIRTTRVPGVLVENVLTEVPPVKNENGDMIYLLPQKFIKGVINHFTGEIIKNPDHNPYYDSHKFRSIITELSA